jgi:hypothetical protein
MVGFKSKTFKCGKAHRLASASQLSPHLLDLLPHLVHRGIAMFQSVLFFVLGFGEQHS